MRIAKSLLVGTGIVVCCACCSSSNRAQSGDRRPVVGVVSAVSSKQSAQLDGDADTLAGRMLVDAASELSEVGEVDDGVLAQSEGSRLPALQHPSGVVRLSVVGFSDAVVSLPVGATEPMPVVIAAHGNYDTPEWQCEVWRDIVQNEAFVLCPRGTARGDSPSSKDIRYHYLSQQRLAQEIDAGMEQLRASYGAYVDDGSLLFTGFSQGAIMGASLMVREPERYSRAVLIEGGDRTWTHANAKKYAEHGGQRVLFACGQGDCNSKAKGAARQLQQRGVDTRVVYSKRQGHTYGGGVADEIAAAFDWLVQGDPRWKQRQGR